MSAGDFELAEYHGIAKSNALTSGEAADAEDIPFVKTESVEGAGKDTKSKSKKSQRPAWFTTVSISVGLASVVLAANAILLAWAYGKLNVVNGIAVAFTGSCSRTTTITTLAELAINVLSTLLLAASNNCSQLLMAPTRADVDRAHPQGKWVHIGVSGFRNIKWIGWWRIALCAVLGISSIPLHLL